MRDRVIRVIAGLLVLTGVALTYYTQNNMWLWVDVFVGVNLFQAGITKWCLLEIILQKLGVEK
jgi:hypothetical protein